MAYTIVSGESLEALAYIVNEWESDGWCPSGGPFVVDKRLWAERPKKDKGQLVAQALVEDREPCSDCANEKDREESPC